MKLLQSLCVLLVTIGLSTAAIAQSKITAESQLIVKADIVFPFVETQSGALVWKVGKGGAYVSDFVIERKYDFECDYSCSVEVELAADAFGFLETRDEGMPSEHDVYIAYGEASVNRAGDYRPWGNCEFQAEEFYADVEFAVLDFKDEEWIDMSFVNVPPEMMEGPEKGFGPCIAPPAEPKLKP